MLFQRVMSAGLNWFEYIVRASFIFFGAFCGAEIVHLYYRPLDGLKELVKEEREKRRKISEEIDAELFAEGLEQSRLD